MKQWRRGRTIFRELRTRGLTVEQAAQVAGNARRWWRNSAKSINRALPNSLFDGLGVPRLAASPQLLEPLGSGPACRVVWEGTLGENPLGPFGSASGFLRGVHWPCVHQRASVVPPWCEDLRARTLCAPCAHRVRTGCERRSSCDVAISYRRAPPSAAPKSSRSIGLVSPQGIPTDLKLLFFQLRAVGTGAVEPERTAFELVGRLLKALKPGDDYVK